MEWADCYDDAMSESVERYIKFREEQKKELAMRWLSDYTDVEKTTSASGPMRRTSARIHRNYPSLVVYVKESDIPGSITEEVTEETEVIVDEYLVSEENAIAISEGKKKCKEGYKLEDGKCVKKEKKSKTTVVVVGRGGYGGHHHDEDKDDNNDGETNAGGDGGGEGGDGGGELGTTHTVSASLSHGGAVLITLPLQHCSAPPGAPPPPGAPI